jgi:heme oxygenase (biliverdin-IX-beta and delta-forming)
MEHCVNQRRFALRAATSVAHAALEHEIGEIATREDYSRYLRAMTRFRGAIEPRLEAFDGAELFKPTMIRDCLIEDCGDLGVTGLAPLTTTIDGAGEHRLGVAYVLEGSSLGAALLIKAAKALGFDGAHGARHLTRQVERRSNWTAFVDHLDRLPAVDMTEVIRAANATFALARAAAGDGVHAAT